MVFFNFSQEIIRCKEIRYWRCRKVRSEELQNLQPFAAHLSRVSEINVNDFGVKNVFMGGNSTGCPTRHRTQHFFNPLKPELNPFCYLLALLGAHHFLHVSRIRVKSLTLRRLMSYIYGAPILDISRSHTTTQHSR